MFENCPKFQTFRDQLQARGVSIQWAWSTRTGAKGKYDDVALALFHGSGFQPAILCGVIQSYGEDGFALYTDPGTDTISDDVDRIVGPRTSPIS